MRLIATEPEGVFEMAGSLYAVGDRAEAKFAGEGNTGSDRGGGGRIVGRGADKGGCKLKFSNRCVKKLIYISVTSPEPADRKAEAAHAQTGQIFAHGVPSL